MDIKIEFLSSLDSLSVDRKISNTLWTEIESFYSKGGRHYHTLHHLDSLLLHLKPLKSNFVNWNTIVFAIVYHDAVYNTLKNNNEEKSADLAAKRLSAINFPSNEIAICSQLILATKKHQPSDRQTDLFTDADLSILGADSATYQLYTKQIRNEYSIYPDLMYNPGRKKVLRHFLEMTRIFKTKEFFEKYDQRARLNLENELKNLR